MPRVLLAALMALSLALGGPLVPTAQAASVTICTTFLQNTTINGHLVVPAGQRCTLDIVTVTGNVTVGSGAILSLSRTTLNGKLTATDALRVDAPGANTIKGSVTISGRTAVQFLELTVKGATSLTGNGFIDIRDSDFGNNLTVTGNQLVDLAENHVGGNLTVHANEFAGVLLNTIGGKLMCKGNDRVDGRDNTAVGGKFGDCADL